MEGIGLGDYGFLIGWYGWLGYGVEVWRWRERDRIKRIEERYLSWPLGIEGRMPGYLVREELQREKLRIRAGRKAWGWEKRMREGKGSEIARRCMEEMRERYEKRRANSGWEKDRRNFFEERGVEIGMLERKEEEGENWYGEMEERDRQMQRRERRERIERARYNKWYKEVKGKAYRAI